MMASLVASLMVGLAFLTLGKLRMIEPALAAPLALSRNPSPSRTPGKFRMTVIIGICAKLTEGIVPSTDFG